MINTLNDYICRSLPEWGDFSTNPNLKKKVADDGSFLPFFGNTVVFDLDEETKTALARLQTELYGNAGWMLSQRLEPSTLHMTLHDLVNGTESSGDLQHRMTEAEHRAKALLRQWQGQPPLWMRTTWLFNMVNTSIVLGLAPADPESWARLDAMYTALEDVVPLGYALTPHITMAYFKPGTYSQEALQCLKRALRPVDLSIRLDMNALYYQEFSDMNHYENK